jgi:hypothetical protein
MASELDDERIDRIRTAIGQLNEPPTNARLRVAVAADGVPCTDDEFELLRRVRRVRSSVLHGASRDLALSADDQQQAVALVNRLLVFRLGALEGSRQSPD